MSFNWSEYLSLAQELTSSSSTSPIQEAHLRAAISRAYYAAFCKARNHLIYKQGYTIPGGANVHQLVVNEFKNSSDVTRKTVGNLLHHLRSIRNVADYEDTFWGNQLGKTKGALVEAERIIKLLGTL